MSSIIKDCSYHRKDGPLFFPKLGAIIPVPEVKNIVSAYPYRTNSHKSIATGLLIGSVVIINSAFQTGGVINNDDLISSSVKYENIANNLDNWSSWAKTTKELLQGQAPTTKPMSGAAAKIRVNRLNEIQKAFGLPTIAIADTLGITRQGLYKWLDDSKDITLQDASLQRLSMVESLSKKWSTRSKVPLNSVAKESLSNGRTVLQLLSDATLDENAIIGAFEELTGKLESKPRSLSQRMTDAGFKRRTSVNILPKDE